MIKEWDGKLDTLEYYTGKVGGKMELEDMVGVLQGKAKDIVVWIRDLKDVKGDEIKQVVHKYQQAANIYIKQYPQYNDNQE